MDYNDNERLKREKRVSAKKQAEYVRFMFITIVIGVILCLVVFFAVFISMNKKVTPVQTSISSISNINTTLATQNLTTYKLEDTEDTTTQIEDDNLEIIAVLMSVNSNGKKIEVYDIEKDKEISLIMKAGAEMKNQYEQAMSLAEFSKGDIVQVVYSKNALEFNSLKISDTAWSLESVTGLSVDTSSSTITIGNKVYKYNSRLIADYGNANFGMLDLTSIDVVSLKGYKDIIWNLKVKKGHGFVTISGKEKIKNGSIEIDTDIYKSLDEMGRITLSEGNHRIVVKGSNIEPYTQEFSVSNIQEVNIDLADAKIKTGVVLLKSNVTDYILYINDEQHNMNEPLILEYGEYIIKATKDEYKDFNARLLVENETLVLNIDMNPKEEVKMGELTVYTDNVKECNVYVDNTYIGITPVTVKLTYGEHRIIVKKDGYADRSSPITIGDLPQNVGFIMHEISTSTPKTVPATNPTQESTTDTTQSSEIEGGRVEINPVY